MRVGDQARVREVVSALDRELVAPVVVMGSLPPAGRDLDLLVRHADRSSVERALAACGFLQRGCRWAVFGRDLSYLVELVTAESDWPIGATALAELFTAATPLPGTRHVLCPPSHHELLFLVRRAAARGAVGDKLARRMANVVAEDPAVWQTAQGHAEGWGVGAATRALEQAHRRDGLAGARLTLRERGEMLGLSGRRRRVMWTAQRARRSRRGAVVAISGLDGAGKSTQVRAVAETLAAVGVDTATEWTPDYRLFASVPESAKRAVFRLLRRERTVGSGASSPALATDHGRRAAYRDVGRRWVPLLALATAVSDAGALRRATRPHLRHGRVVLCDRYALDHAVHLRDRYRSDSAFRRQIALLKRLAPRPVRSFLLHVSPEDALARKTEQYSLDDLVRQERLYADEAARFGVQRLDGTLPPEELRARIAADVWVHLAG